MSCLVCNPSTGTYTPHGRQWIKDKVLEKKSFWRSRGTQSTDQLPLIHSTRPPYLSSFRDWLALQVYNMLAKAAA